MTIAALQFDIAWENKPANFTKVLDLLASAKLAPDSLVALPEMFATGFTMNTESMAENYGGQTEQFLAAAAKEFKIYLLAGAALRGRDGLVRNKALVFSPSGELIAFYAKMKPFSPGGESSHYTAGKEPVVFTWGQCKVAPFVCYDLRFPEIFRQTAAVHRPELFVVISSWPDKRAQHWVTLLQARAIENQAYVLGVNRMGTDPFFNYAGRSVIVDPLGDLVADAGVAESCIRATLDLPLLRKYRTGLPFLDDLTVTDSKQSSPTG
jgi:predicted amidohydrolase